MNGRDKLSMTSPASSSARSPMKSPGTQQINAKRLSFFDAPTAVSFDPWSFLGIKKSPAAAAAAATEDDSAAAAATGKDSAKVDDQQAKVNGDVDDKADIVRDGDARQSKQAENANILSELNQYYKHAAAERERSGSERSAKSERSGAANVVNKDVVVGGDKEGSSSSGGGSEEAELRQSVVEQYRRLLQPSPLSPPPQQQHNAVTSSARGVERNGPRDLAQQSDSLSSEGQ